MYGLAVPDELGTRSHQRPAFRVDDGHQVREQGVLVAVAAAELERHQERAGTGDGGLDRLSPRARRNSTTLACRSPRGAADRALCRPAYLRSCGTRQVAVAVARFPATSVVVAVSV